MTIYTLRIETVHGDRSEQQLSFANDDAAISYALPITRGRALEILRGDRLIAIVDERPCLMRA